MQGFKVDHNLAIHKHLYDNHADLKALQRNVLVYKEKWNYVS